MSLKNIKVLYITNYSGLYGANRSLIDMLLGVRKYGIDPIVLISGHGTLLEKELDKYHIKHISAPFPIAFVDSDTPWLLLRKITRYFNRLFLYKKTIKILEGIDVDIVHTNTGIVEFGYYFSQKRKIPHVWHFREFGEDYGLINIFSKRAMRKKLINSKNIAISKAICDYYENCYNVGNYSIIYNDVKICEKYTKCYFDSGNVNFVIVGAISVNKGQLDVVKAFIRLREEYNNIVLTIVGSGEKSICDDIKKLISEKNLQNSIRMLGYCDNVDNILKTMDVGIMASKMEGLGRVTIEYMANYMMVIGTDSGGTSELIENKDLLFEFGDVENIYRLMRCCVNNLQIVKEIGLKNRDKAEMFGRGRCAEQIVNEYNKLLLKKM